MPYTFNGIGTTYYGKKNVEKYEGVCERCGRKGTLKSYEATYWFVFIFIPIIPLGKKKILDYCGYCTGHRAIPLDEWNRIKTQAISESREKMETNPDDPETSIKMHANLMTFGKHEEAKELAGKMGKKFPDNLEVQLYLGEYYEHEGDVEEADKYFEGALKAAPDDPAARRAVAIACIEKDDLSRASDLLSFMRYKTPDQDPWVLFSLAAAYQKKQRHSEALSYFEIIARDFPDIASTNKDFRKAVQESEKKLGQSQTILPGRQFLAAKKWKRAAILVFALVALFFIASWYLSSHQPLHVVNQLPADATVTVPGHDPLVISPGERKIVKVPEGQYEVNIQVENYPSQPVRVDISNEWYERFFSNKLFILNVARAAVIMWEETTYSESPQPNDPYKYRLYVGESFITIDKTNYKFEPFPETISLDSGSSELRSRVDIFRAAPNIMAAILVEANIAPRKILTYLEAHLGVIHEDENLLSTYLILSQTNNDLQRALKFLEKNLHQRPVWVEWHRFYQSARQVAGQKDKLIAQYDTLLQKEPENSDLLYLRGRLEPGFKSAFAYYDRAIAANSKNSHPYFAKAFHLAGNGELAAARELCDTAVQLNPTSPRMEQMFYQLRFVLKDYDNLEKESMSILSKNPLDWHHFQRLLEIRVARGDNAGAAKALKNYQRTVNKETPQDQYQFKLKSQLQLAYLKGDFNAFARDTAALEDQSLRSENLQVAYLNLGKMEEAEKLPDIKETADGYTCLLYWLGWLEKGNSQKASPWLHQAVKKFLGSSFDENIVGELLKNQKPGKNLINQLADLTIDINSKRVLYVAFARLYPSMRPQLLPLAEKLNHLYQFPYHFLKKIINQMK